MVFKIRIAVFAALLALLISLAGAGFAISADEAIALVTIQNNYMMSGESASAVKEMITYQNTKYLVVATLKGDSVTCYIPVKDSDQKIAAGDIEISALTKAAIVFTKMTQLRENTSSANWIYSYSTKNYLYDLQNEFTQMMGRVITVQTELAKLGSEAAALTQLADETQSQLEAIASKSKDIADKVEAGRKKEETFLAAPDTNGVNSYESTYKDIFTQLENYKSDYTAIETNINKLNQGIGALQTNKLTIDQKRSLQLLLTMSVSARRLPTFFSQNDQLRTIIESVFNSAKNSNSYVETLATRRLRNEAWQLMYGQNATLAKLDPSFTTLEKAASAILSEENAAQWVDQDAVDALSTSWNGATSRFNTAEYEKAKDYATKATNFAKAVMQKGANTTPIDNTQDVVIKIVVGLIIVIIAVFIFDKFLRKSKPKEEEYDEP